MEPEPSLTRLQDLWLTNFIATGNATQSAITAGYSPKCAERMGFDNTRNHKILVVMAQRLGPMLKAKQVNTERILKELSAVAFTPLDECVDYGPGYADIREPKDMSEAARHAVKSVKVTKTTRTERGEDGAEVTRTTTELAMHSKTRALDLLAKICNMIKQGEQGDTNINFYTINYADIEVGKEIAPPPVYPKALPEAGI